MRACACTYACVCVRAGVYVRACVRENAGASSGARLRSTESGKLHIVIQEATLVILLYKIKARVAAFGPVLV